MLGHVWNWCPNLLILQPDLPSLLPDLFFLQLVLLILLPALVLLLTVLLMALICPGFLEVQRMVERLFLVSRLVSPSWHLCLKVSKVYGSDIQGIPGGPEDGREAVPYPPSGQPSLAPLPQGD